MECHMLQPCTFCSDSTGHSSYKQTSKAIQRSICLPSTDVSISVAGGVDILFPPSPTIPLPMSSRYTTHTLQMWLPWYSVEPITDSIKVYTVYHLPPIISLGITWSQYAPPLMVNKSREVLKYSQPWRLKLIRDAQRWRQNLWWVSIASVRVFFLLHFPSLQSSLSVICLHWQSDCNEAYFE